MSGLFARLTSGIREKLGQNKMPNDDGDRPSGDPKPVLGEYLPPEVDGVSTILSPDDIVFIDKTWLPPRLTGCTWKLIFSTDKNGFSLKNMYRYLHGKSNYALLVFKDKNGHRFGAFINEAIRPDNKIHGGGECFVYRMKHEEFAKKYSQKFLNEEEKRKSQTSDDFVVVQTEEVQQEPRLEPRLSDNACSSTNGQTGDCVLANESDGQAAGNGSTNRTNGCTPENGCVGGTNGRAAENCSTNVTHDSAKGQIDCITNPGESSIPLNTENGCGITSSARRVVNHPLSASAKELKLEVNKENLGPDAHMYEFNFWKDNHWPWDREETCFVHAESSRLHIGLHDGKMSIWIDDDLRQGGSLSTKVFNNEPLAPCPKKMGFFRLNKLEVWIFE